MLTFAQFLQETEEKEYDYRTHSGPRTVHYLRHAGGAKQKFNFGSRFGQDVEPHGRYMNERHATYQSPVAGMEHGTVHFKNPLVMPWGDKGTGYDHPSNWKRVLHKKFGTKGRWLSKALIRKGHDGIITHDPEGHSSEIVDLTQFK